MPLKSPTEQHPVSPQDLHSAPSNHSSDSIIHIHRQSPLTKYYKSLHMPIQSNPVTAQKLTDSNSLTDYSQQNRTPQSTDLALRLWRRVCSLRSGRLQRSWYSLAPTGCCRKDMRKVSTTLWSLHSTQPLRDTSGSFFRM